MPRLNHTPLSYEGGVPFSSEYGDVYHSRAGALAQCQAVFLGGNDLPERWKNCTSFQILETGFGLGLNFLETWRVWRQHAPLTARLHFVSVENSPLRAAELRSALAPQTALVEEARALIAAWPVLTPGLHRIEFDHGRVILHLALGPMETLLGQLTLAADAVYLDGFSPRVNPVPWSDPVLRQVARLCRHGATLASWCVAGDVRRTLEHHGFRTWKCPGFGPKRERLQACFDKIPRAAHDAVVRRSQQPALLASLHPPPLRQALVIGAGLAGCLVSYALSRRGWQVSLVDTHHGPAQEASGNPAGILRPFLSLDDNRAARLSRNGFLTTLAWLQRLHSSSRPPCFDLPGALSLPSSMEEAQSLRHLIQTLAFPPALVHWLDAPEAAQLGHCSAPWGGLHFPMAGWVDPGQLCHSALAAAPSVTCLWNHTVTLHTHSGLWEARNDQDQLVATAPIAILATGAQPLPLVVPPPWPRQRLRGQITQCRPDPFPPHNPVLCRDGYIIPGAPGGLCVGATYAVDEAITPKLADQEANLQRLSPVLPEGSPLPAVMSERVAFRSVSRDRLPIIGPVPGTAGLFALTALGSRGLVWAALGADLITAWLEGEPLPLEKELVLAIAPQRYSK
ncbi:MAG: FAD-dependent 5-carboxymethylaminomethyl-2-thiouridine(34) oxidoreductase MnmC [Ferrovum sp.]|nr:FAD-dependent 5-carboxymethylaminomethyl-2-thiouridine(34) oxidoreductase MnmC [Ferrovum sp.]